ncbi:alpha/beta hydrolase family protein [Arundinibacter roseus]|uniref:Dienelactone hydrolase n=1 Tax=Arundinibacter roseus TaxID=2070510 RepID=A0A4R4KI21_9BACT|nr:dienelactone hydrolase [Arundinibacter roseus]TDB67513.1 dienelactone hydrolase [Arundinibacter roseus]
MKYTSLIIFTLVLNLFAFSADTIAQNSFVYGDPLPDAPELSPRGSYSVGVQTLQFTNKGQVNILKSKGGVDTLYDRSLTAEVWYPAIVPTGTVALVDYQDVMGTANDSKRPLIPFTFPGRSLRDAAPLRSEGSFPLLIVSHGYVGSRFLMTYLTENLASKGYIVVAIDHTESTFRDAAPFTSTLLNRAKDILFVLNETAELGKANSKHFLAGIVDDTNTGIIGYSMGGFGALNAAGAGYSEQLSRTFAAMTGGSKAIEGRTTASSQYASTVDSRIKAVVAFAPWGMERGAWNAEGLKGLTVPTFFVAGSQDDISGYEKGIKAIYLTATRAPRYLLTYENARHNIAPNPPPAEALQPGLPFDEYYRYAEPAWNERRINNINQHFVTAFLGVYLKKKDYQKYLNLPENSNEKGWTGFKGRSAVGLQLNHAVPE